MKRPRCKDCGGVLWREPHLLTRYPGILARECRACLLDSISTQEVLDCDPYERAHVLGYRMRAFVSCERRDEQREYAWLVWSTRRDEANAPCPNVSTWIHDFSSIQANQRLSAFAVWPPLPAPAEMGTADGEM